MPVLDTTFLIDLQRGLPGAKRALASILLEDEPVFVPIQAATELGLRTSDPIETVREVGAAFEIFPCDERIAREAVRIGRAAADAGKFPGWADLQIVATAAYNGMALVTRDRKSVAKALGIRVMDY